MNCVVSKESVEKPQAGFTWGYISIGHPLIPAPATDHIMINDIPPHLVFVCLMPKGLFLVLRHCRDVSRTSLGRG